MIIFTSVTPPSSYDLVTLSQVKAELGITSSSEDTLIGGYIKAGSEYIQSFCNQSFVAETVVDTFYIDGIQIVLPLSHIPVATLTSVVEGDTTLSSGDYVLDFSPGLLTRMSSDCSSRFAMGKTVVTYTSGYTTVPQAIQDACIKLVADRYRTKNRDPGLRAEEITGIGRQEFWDATGQNKVDDSVAQALAAYRKLNA